MTHILEAVCRGCGETFIPSDEDDLEHAECGGPGEIVATYN